RRARYLRLGLQELLGDPDGTRLLQEIYNHPLITSLYRGPYGRTPAGNLPSYIPARSFALALMDVIGPGHAAATTPAGAYAATGSGAAGATAKSALPAIVANAAAAGYTSPSFTESFSTTSPAEALRTAT